MHSSVVIKGFMLWVLYINIYSFNFCYLRGDVTCSLTICITLPVMWFLCWDGSGNVIKYFICAFPAFFSFRAWWSCFAAVALKNGVSLWTWKIKANHCEIQWQDYWHGDYISLFLLAMYLLWYNCAFIFRQRTFIRKRGHWGINNRKRKN